MVIAKWNGKEIGTSPVISKTLDPDWGRFEFDAFKVDATQEDGVLVLEALFAVVMIRDFRVREF